MHGANSVTLPVMFVGHGAAVMTTDPSDATHRWMVGFERSIAELDPPGFVVVSAHHLAAPISVTAHEAPALMHDHPASHLYAERYDAPGNPALAHELVERLTGAGLPAVADPGRAIDHGAWLPLRHWRPRADRFVVQVSMPSAVDWEAAVALGRVLGGVRDRAVVLGSGGLTHDQAEFRRRYFAGAAPSAPAPEPHRRFEAWVLEVLDAPDRVERLLDARAHPDFAFAHPTPEHFVPLVVACASALADAATVVFRGSQHGLSTTAVRFDP